MYQYIFRFGFCHSVGKRSVLCCVLKYTNLQVESDLNEANFPFRIQTNFPESQTYSQSEILKQIYIHSLMNALLSSLVDGKSYHKQFFINENI